MESLLLRAEGLQLYEKETPAQVFFGEYYEIFKIIFFIEHASGDAFWISPDLKSSPEFRHFQNRSISNILKGTLIQIWIITDIFVFT